MSIENGSKLQKLLVMATSELGREFIEKHVEDLTRFETKTLLINLLQYQTETNTFTPPADWLINGKNDPHDHHYTGSERSNLTLGNYTDDRLANAVFMVGDKFNPSNPFSGIGVLTAAKERIRWLSRRLHTVEEAYMKLKPRMYTVKNGDTLSGIAQRFNNDPESWRELHENNRHIPNPHRIKAGDTLSLPETWFKKINLND